MHSIKQKNHREHSVPPHYPTPSVQFVDNRARAQRIQENLNTISPNHRGLTSIDRIASLTQQRGVAQRISSKEMQPRQNDISQRKPNNTGLPDTLKNRMEDLSGLSMDEVKVHYGSNKPGQLNALAYTQGTDIHVAPGQEKHLPHEAWHVVQQMQGRVQPTITVNGDVPINDDAELEREADRMGGMA